MNYYVYAIHSFSLEKTYIGQTQNIEKRLADHNKGYSKYTSKSSDWILFYHEVFKSRSAAIKREKQLKSYRGREFLCKKLNELQD